MNKIFEGDVFILLSARNGENVLYLEDDNIFHDYAIFQVHDLDNVSVFDYRSKTMENIDKLTTEVFADQAHAIIEEEEDVVYITLYDSKNKETHILLFGRNYELDDDMIDDTDIIVAEKGKTWILLYENSYEIEVIVKDDDE